MSLDRGSKELGDEVARLARELQVAQRQLSQMQRIATTSETMADRSKRALLHTYDQQKQLVDQLRHAKATAEQATLAKSAFLAVMSHELRTPLHGILGSADLLLQHDLAPPAMELARLLFRAAMSLQTIVDDVLDYSRIEAGQMHIERIPFRFEDTVLEVLALQADIAGGKRIRLLHSIDSALAKVVVGDPVRLRQVLLNLVTNALKFTAQGEVEVRVRPGPDQDSIAFTVRDTGIGIPLEAQVRLFTAFQQADSTTTRRFGGTGLGLAICRQLVRLMGGEIEVHSEPGVGSEFRFHCMLPEARQQEASPEAEKVSTWQGHHRVLVVDDNDGNRLLMRRMLERLGCSIEEASDGQAAVAAIARGAFDVVLMDCSMPVMDGFEATRKVRELDGGKANVPIVAMTANALAEDKRRCLDAGMDGYLSKPVRSSVLRSELERLLPD